jgi:hypothetical protein
MMRVFSPKRPEHHSSFAQTVLRLHAVFGRGDVSASTGRSLDRGCAAPFGVRRTSLPVGSRATVRLGLVRTQMFTPKAATDCIESSNEQRLRVAA